MPPRHGSRSITFRQSRTLNSRDYPNPPDPNPTPNWQAALKVQGCEMALDEVECIVATLIATGFIKGYISHQHAKVVLSKDKAFPPLSTLMG